MTKYKDKYLDYINSLSRLKTEYNYYGNLFIAVDFDHTLYDFDENGDTYYKVIEEVKRAQSLGLCIILYTCREDEKLEFAVNHCKEIGINPTYINENPILNTRKVYYSLFLDDRAGLGESYKLLCDILDYIEDIDCVKYPHFITNDDKSIFVLTHVYNNHATYYLPNERYINVSPDLKNNSNRKEVFHAATDEQFIEKREKYGNRIDVSQNDLLIKIIKELNI